MKDDSCPDSSQRRRRPTRPRRVLVTGSRRWTDTATIRDVLSSVWGDGSAVLVSGACPTGADRIAETIWTGWGGRVERHPADWARHGRAAGFRRNAQMIHAGATLCLRSSWTARPEPATRRRWPRPRAFLEQILERLLTALLRRSP